MRLRFSGFGGQGILVAGNLTGSAAVIEGHNALTTQAYTSEARGGLCRSDVVVEDGEIHELELEEVDVLVCLSQQACDRFLGGLRPGGTLVIDADLVKPPEGDFSVHAVPFAGIAKRELGSGIAGNMVLLGFLASFTGLVSDASMRAAIAAQLPKGTEAVSLAAFERGLGLGREDRAGRRD